MKVLSSHFTSGSTGLVLQRVLVVLEVVPAGLLQVLGVLLVREHTGGSGGVRQWLMGCSWWPQGSQRSFLVGLSRDPMPPEEAPSVHLRSRRLGGVRCLHTQLTAPVCASAETNHLLHPRQKSGLGLGSQSVKRRSHTGLIRADVH